MKKLKPSKLRKKMIVWPFYLLLLIVLVMVGDEEFDLWGWLHRKANGHS